MMSPFGLTCLWELMKQQTATRWPEGLMLLWSQKQNMVWEELREGIERDTGERDDWVSLTLVLVIYSQISGRQIDSGETL